jgi:hypothetical protein
VCLESKTVDSAEAILGDLGDNLGGFYEWAMTWHKQAGGYMASDTYMCVFKMERIMKRIERWKAGEFSPNPAKNTEGGSTT